MARRRRRVVLGAQVVVVVALAVSAVLVWRAVKPPEVTAFYRAPSVTGAAPGTLLKVEEIGSKVAGARLWRILYTSTDAHGAVVPVSGLIAAPTHLPPPGGYPLVAVAHGTVGINQGCAPSLDPWAKADAHDTTYSFLVGQYVKAGYATVMADYEGLGVRGTNSYLVGDVEGHDILDSVRAARRFDELRIADGTLIAGQSQGGHAALFAGLLAPRYAPDVDLLGIVAQAPATDLETMFVGVMKAGKRGGIVSLPLMAADAYSRTYAGVHLDQVLTSRGRASLRNVVDSVCLLPAVIGTQLARPKDLIKANGLTVLRPSVERNIPGSSFGVPVLVAQGTADQVVPPSITATYVTKLCADTPSVTSHTYSGVGHFDVVKASTPDVLAWMEKVRAGRVPRSNCAG
jgi:alpha-beta hydrolase superfamily lysophospholipase